MTVRSHLSCNR